LREGDKAFATFVGATGDKRRPSKKIRKGDELVCLHVITLTQGFYMATDIFVVHTFLKKLEGRAHLHFMHTLKLESPHCHFT
jgi:hypothetical protein